MTDQLADRVLAGRRRAIARTISLIENNGPEARALLAALHPYTGRAHIVGVTGPPGSGKSTLVNALAWHYRHRPTALQAMTVGIIAVDPTSPFSGGAILGDRVRMRDLAGDPRVFIRSMASRGNLGGLAWATADAVKVLDAAGYDLIIVETVGAGQAEVDIARTAHTTVVVEMPGLGDDIQAIKAGILEIADIFAVNKADLEGADHAVMALRMMLDLNTGGQYKTMHHGRLMEAAAPPGRGAEKPPSTYAWQPPVLKTIATQREGVAELAGAVLAHRVHLEESGELYKRERERAAAELEAIIQHEALRRAIENADQGQLASLIEKIAQRQLDPYAASQHLIS